MILGSAKGFKGFEIYNNIGPVSQDGPFELFGPLPVVGAFFELHTPQVFNHFTRPLTLFLDWRELPDGDLSKFMVELRSGGQTQQVPLFSKSIPLELTAFEENLRVTLMAPAEAFGHLTYANRVAEAILHHLPIPATPYIPVVNQLWLDYEW